MRRLLWLGLMLVVVVTPVWVIEAQGGLSRQQIETIALSVVQIVALDEDGREISAGSGTVVDRDGTILTNRHVVDAGSDYAIYVLEDLRERPVLRYYATLTGVAANIDLAALQIDRDEDGNRVNASRLDLSFIGAVNDDVGHGEGIYIFGFPDLGNGYLVVTQGTITTIENGDFGNARLPNWYQTDAEVSPGNSGGLAVNLSGEFIGIPTAVETEGETLGRLGGITPFPAIQAVLDGEGLVSLDEVNSIVNNVERNPQLVGGVSVTCGNMTITNGVEFVIRQMRAGFTYTATAVGIDGFDPALAVFENNSNTARCNDDAPAADYYEADLPTSGLVTPSSLTAQLAFSQNSGRGLNDVRIVVGGMDNQAGEFVLILEGMVVTEADGNGDPFSVRLTPGMVGWGRPLTLYMISLTGDLDPLMYLADFDWEPVRFGSEEVSCDDAGFFSLCWGDSEDLSNSYVSLKQGAAVGGYGLDAMLVLPISGLDEVRMEDEYVFDFVMTSSSRESFGDYVVVMHVGTQ
ncbi:MAG: trypsin-like peptidase domain-containing protein [Anaerolineae bacterium]|nr:trypsin-like peptidase domain-containing protein [Anaerolineae bacterium]